jgi:hypothetical protein
MLGPALAGRVTAVLGTHRGPEAEFTRSLRIFTDDDVVPPDIDAVNTLTSYSDPITEA